MEPEWRACEWCGELFFVRRSDARYCPGSKCRTAAHRARKRAEAQATRDKRSALQLAIERVTSQKKKPDS